MKQPTWGLVSTIRADTRDILNFAAHHLDLGAHRVHIYLDAPNETAQAALRAHPKCRVTLCDDDYWRRRGKRPDKHQPRQTINATRCYNRRPQVDWLAHIDVDEFLWPEASLPGQLATLPDDTFSARVRPIEALAPDPADPPDDGLTWFKACTRMRGARMAQTPQIYPRFGARLDGGFLSHVAGKVFVRTGHENVSLRIHNAFHDGVPDKLAPEIEATRLCHLHAPSLEKWKAAFRFRLRQGSYRDSLKPIPTPDGDGLTMNQLLSGIEAEGGESALDAFYHEVCVATPDLRERLHMFGLLRAARLELDTKRARHFPRHA
ncbi:glycosyltransferase family 2 protein [Roseovarius sp. SYSU LYC5161]|uniref:glycosyltransferase family 2 protein n=1 Tax=Roseovarius halophilus (ex Wu et al. 2025) TaxID=3376060 RepID=UPI003999D7C8